MKIIKLKSVDPYYNLAVEEYLLKYSDDDYFMLWQNEPTIVIGKNQNVFAEIDTEYTRSNKINISRRITGGGAVYHDLGNVNYSFVVNGKNNSLDFDKFTKPIIRALNTLSVKCELSGRNDLTVCEKKISGNAQTVYKDRVLHHGTLLFNSDLNVLSYALRVDPEKIKSKAVRSYRSRVANIYEFIDDKSMKACDFIDLIYENIKAEFNAEPAEIVQSEVIEALVERNSSDEWLYPQRSYLSEYDFISKKRFDFGTVSLSFKMKNDLIVEAKIEGDFFEINDVSLLENCFIGKFINNLDSLFEKINVSDYIFNMSNDDFCSLIKK